MGGNAGKSRGAALPDSSCPVPHTSVHEVHIPVTASDRPASMIGASMPRCAAPGCGSSPPMAPASGDLADAPEERQRPLDHAAHVLAPGLVGQEEAGRRIDHAVERGLVEPPYRHLFLVQALGLIPSRDL